MQIKLYTPKPIDILDQDLAYIEEPLNQMEKLIIDATIALNSSLARLWILPDDRILNILNHLGPEKVMGIFAIHEATATALNQMLDSRSITSHRANIGKPRELNVVDGVFELVPLPVVEPVVEPVV